MNEFIEQLESRQLLSASYPAAATYNGFAVPKGHPSQAAYIADLGVAKTNGDRATAALDVTIANNSVVTGTLDLQGNSYDLSGTIVGVYVSVSIEKNGIGVGTFDGMLKARNKTLSGPLTLSLNGAGTQTGAVTTAEMALTNDNVKTKKGGGGKNSQNEALVPGYVPNQTPPPITTGGSNNSIGDRTGLTGGNNSVIGSGDGSILG